jgi:hypothetical protein
MTRTIILVALLAMTTGCFTVNAALPGTLRNDVKSDQTEKVGSLNIEKTNWFFLYGLIGSPPEDVFATEIKSQVQARGADGVANLTYEAKTGCVDLIIGQLTCQLVTPRSYVVTGDIVRIKAAPLPGKPAKAADASDVKKTEELRVAQGY